MQSMVIPPLIRFLTPLDCPLCCICQPTVLYLPTYCTVFSIQHTCSSMENKLQFFFGLARAKDNKRILKTRQYVRLLISCTCTTITPFVIVNIQLMTSQGSHVNKALSLKEHILHSTVLVITVFESCTKLC